MTPQPHLIAVSDDSLPDYPLERSDRIKAHHFVAFWHRRWLNSELHLTASHEVQGMALNLFFIAQEQAPLGTLPDDDFILSRLLRVDMGYWKEVRARRVGPLHNWHRCRCDGEIRLMHPVVTEVAMDAMAGRAAREAKTSAAAVKMRINRLKQALRELGLRDHALADDVLINRMDAWLDENHKGQRKMPQYERVLRHAATQQWFGVSATR